MPSFPSQSDLELAVLQILSDSPLGQAEGWEVAQEFERRFESAISPSLERKWRRMIYEACAHLQDRGRIDRPASGIWRINEAGAAHLAEKNNFAPIPRPSADAAMIGPGSSCDEQDQALERAPVLAGEDVSSQEKVTPAPEIEERQLTKAAFVSMAATALQGRFLELGQAVTLRFPRDILMEVHLPGYWDCHFEVWLHTDVVEIGLRFEIGPKSRHDRMAAFLLQQDALSRALGQRILVEKCGPKWAKVYLVLPESPLTATAAQECAGLVERLVCETLPVLASAVAPEPKRSSIKPVSDQATSAHAILDDQISSMQEFLNGRGDRPSDESLCDWVCLCYRFELYRVGHELFRLVDTSQVNPWYYERTRRLAKVCAMKVVGQA